MIPAYNVVTLRRLENLSKSMFILRRDDVVGPSEMERRRRRLAQRHNQEDLGYDRSMVGGLHYRLIGVLSEIAFIGGEMPNLIFSCSIRNLA